MTSVVVRNEHGAILGIDWRRVTGMVPGPVAAEWVMPGDRIVFDGQLVTVLWRALPTPVRVMITVRTPAGGEIVLERYTGDVVNVVDVGAFDVPEVTA